MEEQYDQDEGVAAEMRAALDVQREEMMGSGGSVADLDSRVKEARLVLEALEREYKDAWSEAVKSGWAASQLTSFGLSTPATATRRRSSRAKKVAPRSDS